jgi:sugar phosphate isomerase/epimerase
VLIIIFIYYRYLYNYLNILKWKEIIMDIGVVSRSFPSLSNEQTAESMSLNGFKWIELCFCQTDSKYWVYNGRSDISTLTDEKSRKIIETYRRYGVAVTSIGVFTNLLDPLKEELELNISYFERHMQIASINNIRYVSTECGFVPGKRGINADNYESSFQYLLQNIGRLASLGEKYNVCIALETCVLDVIPSAKRAADFIKQVGSPNVKILLDPANLIANSSEEDMFRYLGPYIAYFHGKDRKVNDAYGRVVGDGDINWRLFLQLYHKHTEGVPFILEYVNLDNFCEIRDRISDFDKIQT